MADAAFLEGEVNTTYIDRRFPDRPHAWSEGRGEVALVAAAIHSFSRDRARPAVTPDDAAPGVSPWVLARGRRGCGGKREWKTDNEEPTTGAMKNPEQH